MRAAFFAPIRALTAGYKLPAVVVVTSALCIALIVALWNASAVPQILFGRDVMYLLDGASNWYFGIFPYKDYQSPTGPLAFFLIAAGMHLGGGLVDAIPVAICLYAALLLPVALYSCFSRLHLALAAVATLVLVAAACAPRLLQFGSDSWSYAAFYSRLEYPLICILLLVCLVVPSQRAIHVDKIDGAIAGAAAVMLLFSTSAVGLLALVFILGSAAIYRRPKLYYLVAAGAAFVVFLLFALAAGWSPLGVLSGLGYELSLWLRTRSVGLPQAILASAPKLLILALAAACYYSSGIREPTRPMWTRAAVALWLLFCFAAAELAVSPTQWLGATLRDSPVWCIAGIIFVDGAFRRVRDSQQQVSSVWPVFSQVAVVLLAMLLLIPTATRDLRSIVAAARRDQSGEALAPRQRFESGAFAGLHIRYFGGDPPLRTSYVEKVEDGLALLARTVDQSRTAVALDYSNPFNAARKIRDARTEPVAWPSGFLHSEDTAPSAEAVFRPGAVVLLPKTSGNTANHDLQRLQRHYRDFLEQNYTWAAESQQWQLLVRKD